MYKVRLVKLSGVATRGKYKYKAIIQGPRVKSVYFGALGYSDYPHHKDKKRKERYITRHHRREDWKDIYSAGFWSRWLLWNKPTIEASKIDMSKTFGIRFV
jgi:hypothetical protein